MSRQTESDKRWTLDRAAEWVMRLPWICGFNYLPSTSVNFLEMWHEDGFDPNTIDREFGWAAELGFNAVRFNLNYLVWQYDRKPFYNRLEQVLQIANQHGLFVVPVLFDDCGFGGAEPAYGSQPDPIPGVHNSRAVASPGRAAVMDQIQWPNFRNYVQAVIRTFKDDKRLLFWDLYNEPGNRMIFRSDGCAEYTSDLIAYSQELLNASFAWARDINPAQPLTAAAWHTPSAGTTDQAYQNETDQLCFELSDIVTFHAYRPAIYVSGLIDGLKKINRPLFCTEWMARAVDSCITDQLELYSSQGVGCFQWGLVQGRTQTHLPWPKDLLIQHGLSSQEIKGWFHDLLTENGAAYREDEVAAIRKVTSRSLLEHANK